MKEWIYKDGSGEYVLTTDPEVANLAADAVEIPIGAELYCFWHADNEKAFHGKNGFFVDGNWEDSSWTLSEVKSGESGAKILWQRQPPNETEYLLQGKNGEKLLESIEQLKANNVDSTLVERESQYGSFSDVAELTCDLMGDLLRPDMSFVQREALHMICSKLARIRCGDIDKIDSWHDIAGYATLVVQDLEKKAIDADKINQSDNQDWIENLEKNP